MGASYSETSTESVWGYWEEEGSEDASVTPEPWGISITDGTASFSNCVYRRGPVTLQVTVDDVSVGTGVVYLAARINTETGASDIISGSSLSAVTDTSVPAESLYIKIPLYALSTVDGATSVLVDYRKAVNLTLYV